jgi:hypothetical protein
VRFVDKQQTITNQHTLDWTVMTDALLMWMPPTVAAGRRPWSGKPTL